MNEQTVARKRIPLAGLRQVNWLAPLIFLLVGRIVLSGLALAATNTLPFAKILYEYDLVALDPQKLPGVWLRFDAGYYLNIAREGYSGDAKQINFLPAYPLMIRWLAGGSHSMEANAWAGLAISNLALILGGLLLWRITREESGPGAAWAALVSLAVFPTAFFFSAIYSESLFLLLSLLVYWLARRGRYELAALAVSAASVTRVTGILLALILLVEILAQKPARLWLRLLLSGALASSGMLAFLAYNWAARGSPIAFITAQSVTMGRSITPPWVTLIDSVAAIAGVGEYRDNWFSRLATLQDLAAMLLFAALAVLAFWKLRKSLAWYGAAAMLALFCSHGPSLLGVYSGARYVLMVFPGFIVMGMLLDRYRRFKWLAWSASALLMVGLTAWWVTGHWVS